jgi:hypothetical protein
MTFTRKTDSTHRTEQLKLHKRLTWVFIFLFTVSGVGMSTPHLRRRQSLAPTQDDNFQVSPQPQAPHSALSHTTGSSYYATPSPPVHSSALLHTQPPLTQTSDCIYPSVLPPIRDQSPAPPHQWGDSSRDFDVYDRIEQLSRWMWHQFLLCIQVFR